MTGNFTAATSNLASLSFEAVDRYMYSCTIIITPSRSTSSTVSNDAVCSKFKLTATGISCSRNSVGGGQSIEVNYTIPESHILK